MIPVNTGDFAQAWAYLSTGVRLPYVTHGNPAGLPLIFLYGATDSWRSFAWLLPHLPRDFYSVPFTQRGHGDADKPIAGYRSHDFAAACAALLDELQFEKAVLVGHSMESLIAQRFALNYPARLAGLVLMGPLATCRNNPVIEELWEGAIVDLEDPALAHEFQISTLAQAVPQNCSPRPWQRVSRCRQASGVPSLQR